MVVTDATYLFELFVVRCRTFPDVNVAQLYDGKIGYTNIRGRHDNSYESQLEKQVKCNINFTQLTNMKSYIKFFNM